MAGSKQRDDPWSRLRDEPVRRRAVRRPRLGRLTARHAAPPSAAVATRTGSGGPRAGVLPREDVGPPDDGEQQPSVAPLRGPHLVVVALLGVAALVLTGLVLAAAQPRASSVPLDADPVTSSATAGPSGAGSATGSTATGSTATGSGATGSGGDPVPSPPASPTAQPAVVVHVAGTVARPGVVVLPAGSRVVDAVDAVGGPLPGTSLDSVNLARLLVDGEQVRVGIPPDDVLAAPTGPTASGGVGAGSPAAPATGARPVDLNSATAADLDALPGIGPVLAQRIVDWRRQNGPFASVEELLEVSGIGPSVLADLQGRVTV